MQQAGTAKLIDIRDIRELQREGRIDGAFHAPRGMLEFWADPDSPYHKDIFATKNYRLLYFVTIPQGKALKMGQTLLTFIESSAFKARLERTEVLKS